IYDLRNLGDGDGALPASSGIFPGLKVSALPFLLLDPFPVGKSRYVPIYIAVYVVLRRTLKMGNGMLKGGKVLGLVDQADGLKFVGAIMTCPAHGDGPRCRRPPGFFQRVFHGSVYRVVNRISDRIAPFYGDEFGSGDPG